MVHQPRVGYNDKARGSVAGGRKKGKRHSKTSAPPTEQSDPNVIIHIPKSSEEKDLERRERVKQELAAQANSKMSGKKKKRLEKYILNLNLPSINQEKKLKKEERVVLFEKLSQSQAQLPTTLHLQSSSTLGTGRPSTNRERLEKLDDKETRRAIDGRAGKRKRGLERYDITSAGSGDDESDFELLGDDTESPAHAEVTHQRGNVGEVIVVDGGMSMPPRPVAAKPAGVGSALQRNSDGSVVAPRISTKKLGRKTAFSSWTTRKQPVSMPEDSDTSFNSSDSANDTSDEEGSGAESGEEVDDDGEEASDDEEAPRAPKKKLGFKDWALKQLSVAKGYGPAPETDPMNTFATPEPAHKKVKISHHNPSEMRGPLGEDLHLPSTSLSQHLSKPGSTTRKTIVVNRPPEIAEARMLLPIVAEEQPIMEAVLLNYVVVICGETGSGKTTQVPQFLYEAGFSDPLGGKQSFYNPGMIGITQPRRVAAMSMAARVSAELALPSSRVSYQIRYDATVSPSTGIKFMTDGVLLRELAGDFLLRKYSVIIVDEAHERSMNTDILIGVLSRVIKLREEMWKEDKEDVKPLRLIIMSATLRVSDFASNTRLFATPPPVINVAARQHPVTVHFARRTPTDYVGAAVKKATKIHTKLPPGGILIFLTGQNEIVGAVRKLEGRLGKKTLDERKMRRGVFSKAIQEEESIVTVPMTSAHDIADVEAEDIDFGHRDEDLAFDVDEEMREDPEALNSDDDDDALNEELGIDIDESEVPMHVVPLYSLLPSEKQMRVFQEPPPGHRLVVVSTNVAETSLTIPGIRYVIDCGRSKERRYDIANGIQAFQVSWISKASAAQRSGRAGRTGPGHCYRLYSSALFEHYFEAFSQPEILRMPIEGVVLQMKSMHIDAVVNFPFPTPPDDLALRKAETVLTHLGAIGSTPLLLNRNGSDVIATGTIGGHVTELGKAMSLFPLSPRFSRMLVSGRQHGCLPYVVSIVSALSVGDPFLREEGIEEDDEAEDKDDKRLSHLRSEDVKAKEARKLRRRAFFQSQQAHGSLGGFASDIFRLLSVVGAYEYAGGGHKFCNEHFVRPKVEDTNIQNVCAQLTRLPKAMEEIHKLRAQISAIVQSNFPAISTGPDPNLRPPNDLQLKVLKQLLTAAFIDQVAIRKDLLHKGSSTGNKYATSNNVEYQAIGIAEDVFLHPSSVMFNAPPPEYVVFHEVVRTSRVWLKGITVINPSWLSSLGKPSLCTFSKPLKSIAGVEMITPRFGPDGWELPPIKTNSIRN
ncbi:hypothetical protein HWV62_25164 [Athelia sp. TMB]|nr:hypothetical protein HWV62_25164 [Athelia sp. TMB]